MQRKLAHLAAGLALLIPFTLTGCKVFEIMKGGTGHNPATTQVDAPKPTVETVVNYLNENARRVKNLRATVDIDASQGRRTIGLSGLVACQKPLDFRLKAKILGNEEVDIGSNSERFWYWIRQDNQTVYHCSYKDLTSGGVRMHFPFQPEMVVAAMGIAEYDPNAKYELRDSGKNTLELIQTVKAADGQQAQRITVFNKHRVNAANGQPQVVAHVLRDTRGKMICQATVQRVQIDKGTNAVIPTSVVIEWPATEMALKLKMWNIQTNQIGGDDSSRLFSMETLKGYNHVDLARDTRDLPTTGTRRVGANLVPRR